MCALFCAAAGFLAPSDNTLQSICISYTLHALLLFLRGLAQNFSSAKSFLRLHCTALAMHVSLPFHCMYASCP